RQRVRGQGRPLYVDRGSRRRRGQECADGLTRRTCAAKKVTCMIPDELFLRFTRARSQGGINPGLDLGFPPEITERASDHGDIREDLIVLYALTKGMEAK